MSFIETDWDKIIKETAQKYYENKHRIQIDDIRKLDFLKYSELVTAVSSMVVKNNVAVCTSNCAEIVTKMWDEENKMLTNSQGENFIHLDLSAIKPIIEGLLKAANFRDKDDNQITSIEKTNFLLEIDTGFMGKAKPVLTGGGLTQRSKQQWRKEVTRRVQQARLEKK